MEHTLTPGMTLGRLPSSTLVVDDASISRRHATVEAGIGSELLLVDQGSSNGCFRNGERLERFELRPGDLVTLGAVAFDVVEEESDGTFAESESMEDPAPVEVREADLERARLRREMVGDGRSRGLGDLGQQSLPIKLLVTAAGIAVAYGVFYGVRLLAGSL